MDEIRRSVRESLGVKQSILDDEALLVRLSMLCQEAIGSYRNGGKMLLCGNGGSAADAQHIAAELSGRFYYDRPPLDAEALHVNTSYLTAVANDYSYDEVFVRMTEARGRKGDVFIGLSTSGNSENILRAARKAKEMGMVVAAFTGRDGGKLRDVADILINIPSADTPRIQEGHILMGHILCETIEKALFPSRD